MGSNQWQIPESSDAVQEHPRPRHWPPTYTHHISYWVTHQLLTSPPHQVLLGPSQVYPGSHGSSVQLQLHNFYVQSCGLLQEGPHLSLPWHEVLGLRGGEEQGGQEKAVRLLKKIIKDVMAQVQTHITLIQLSPSYLRMKQLSSLTSMASPQSRSWGKPGRSWLLRES